MFLGRVRAFAGAGADTFQGPVIVACPDGGTSIEDLAESNPELILKVRKLATFSSDRQQLLCVGCSMLIYLSCVCARMISAAVRVAHSEGGEGIHRIFECREIDRFSFVSPPETKARFDFLEVCAGYR